MGSSWLDLATQRWVRATGRRVDLSAERWLQGPVGGTDVIGSSWLSAEADRLEASVTPSGQPAGLLASMAALDGDAFTAADLAPSVRDFYEQTSRWRLDAWVAWSSWAWPFGWLLSTAFARRLEQLALPLRPLDVAHGMTSTVTPLRRDGEQVAALWLRRLRSTGVVVFSGLYSAVAPRGSQSPAIKVAFPLPNGRLVVLLTPRVGDQGSLVLSSSRGGWGGQGAYLVVDTPGGSWARRIPIHEQFHVHVDDEGVLRTDHSLALGPLPVLRLHYRLTPSQDA
ncbi:hypothetical protein [Actinotalea sp. C106]|uniref:hypothetical protein n=1 Tax=Actinotalea sp. C106 TaxID=2908644 RepID=UPI00202818B3|nr:hypothetical protein [Actinotalea sp. C106]